MKRYTLFMYITYYPAGGMRDAVMSSNSLDDIMDFYSKLDEEESKTESEYGYKKTENAHIYDAELFMVKVISGFDESDEWKVLGEVINL